MSRKRDTVVVVRKIQVLVDTEDAEEANAVRQKIYGWQEICFRAANYICTHQFVQDRIRDFVYLTEEVRLKLSETSRENTTYQMLSAMYKGQIPMNMMASLNHSLVQQYNAERNAYWSGQHSLRNYKKGLGLPVPPSDFKLSRDEKSGEY
ncbi:hypothetical protein DDR33_24630, partial [Pararcticibacter amylolyticus]